jgi:hypothetical protein
MLNNYQKIKAKNMFENGFSTKRISTTLKVDYNQIKSFISENNLSIVNRDFSIEEIPRIVKLYKEGVSAKNLAIIYSIDRRRIFKYLKQDSSVSIRTSAEGKRNHHFNEKIFDTINTKEKAYWLGFLMADGCNQKSVNYVYITLKGNDKPHLEKFAKFVGMSIDRVLLKIGEYNNKPYPAATIRLYSKHLCLQLEKLGCMPNKSLSVKFPEYLDENLYSHFIRGLFDGDGCLTYSMDGNYKQYGWGLTSTYEMLFPIKNCFSNDLDMYVGLHNSSKTGKNTWSIECSGNLKIVKLLNWLYKDAGPEIRLDRKYNKYIECINVKRREEVILDDNHIKNICEMRGRNIAINKIATKYKVSPKRIQKILKENNISIKRLSNFNIMNQNLLDSISSDESAYCLGAICAKINSKYKDIDVSSKKEKFIKKLSESLYYNDSFVKKYESRGRTYFRLSINNDYLQNRIRDIIEDGKFCLTSLYYKSFIQGAFDFNGHFNKKDNCYKIKINNNLTDTIILMMTKNSIIKVVEGKLYNTIWFR